MNKVVDGVDVAASGSSVWVASGAGKIWRVDPATGQATFVTTMASVQRLSAGPAIGAGIALWVVPQTPSDPITYRIVLVTPVPVGGAGSIDVAAGDSWLSDNTSASDVFRIAENGVLYQFHRIGGSFQWQPITQNHWPRFRAVAVERRPATALGYPEIWLIREDHAVVALHALWTEPSPGAPGALDLGASSRSVWVVSTLPGLEAGAAGTQVYRYEKQTQRWYRLPGWGHAIDVDEEDRPWVLDAKGSLYSFGTRIPGIADGFRQAPKPGETWPHYFEKLYGGFMGADLTLASEIHVQSRAAGAAATILLVPWSDFAAQDATAYAQALGTALTADRGIDLLYCLAPIFSFSERVPNSVRELPGVSQDGVVDFANPLVALAYVEAVKTLALVPGFRERVRYFSLGNEVDLYLIGKGVMGQAFIQFCAAVAPKVRELLPHTKVGVCWTLRGITNYAEAFTEMSKDLDVLIATYYAHRDVDFAALQPGTYQAEFPGKLPSLASALANKPIVLQEVGMPSDTELGGSEAQQAAFVSYVLSKWDELGLGAPFLSWWSLYDYLYDPDLEVELANPAVFDSAIVVKKSTYPQTASVGGTEVQFFPVGNLLPEFFFGPKRPNLPLLPGEPPHLTNADRVYFLKQSVVAAAGFCRMLSSCGLLRADGTPKPSFTAFSDWARMRRVPA